MFANQLHIAAGTPVVFEVDRPEGTGSRLGNVATSTSRLDHPAHDELQRIPA